MSMPPPEKWAERIKIAIEARNQAKVLRRLCECDRCKRKQTKWWHT